MDPPNNENPRKSQIPLLQFSQQPNTALIAQIPPKMQKIKTPKSGDPYLTPHLVAGDRDEEEMSPVGIVGAEATLANVLEEVALAGVLPGELPGRLVERVGIAVGVYVHLESPLHLSIVQAENARRMVNIRELLLVHAVAHRLLTRFFIANKRFSNGDLRSGGGRERGMEGVEGEVGE